MRDVPPSQTPLWRYLEDTVCAVLDAYGYGEIRMPILEPTELFKRSIGEVTDIVEKEMYTFADRNGDSLTMRPEGTAGCVRAAMELGLLHNQIQRLWYQGPMFRHERPQKGRFRQFHQIGVETYGLATPDIDVEVILISARIWKKLGLNNLELQINSLGTSEERVQYRQQLVDYFNGHKALLDEDSLRRLESNPLRILDSKNPEMQEMLSAAPSLLEHLGEESLGHFEQVKNGLVSAGVNFTLNTRLVRGLDYYSRTVFEWVTTQLGAQGTVCAGGRYDGLVEQLGGRATPAMGFAMGLERLISLLEEQSLEVNGAPHLYVIPGSDAEANDCMLLAEGLRDEVQGLRVLLHCGGGGFKARIKKADKSGATAAVILGEQEREKGVYSLKPLRGGDQREVSRMELTAWCRGQVNSC